MAPMKKFWDDGKLAVMHGVGYLDSPRSHFRAMDIWHTCEPEKVGTEGWLGRVAREFDPKKENVVRSSAWGPACSALCSVPRRAGGLRRRPAGAYGFLPQVQGKSAAPCARSLRQDVQRRSAAA